MAELNRSYHGIPTQATDARSPIPAGRELNVDFINGHLGTPASNGDNFYWYVSIGSASAGPDVSPGTLGVTRLGGIRSLSGNPGSALKHTVVGSVFSNEIQALAGIDPANALTSGNLAYATYAIEGTLAHEIGHAFSLTHVDSVGSVQLDNVPPLMGTGAVDLLNQDRLGPREFSVSGVDSQDGGATVNQLAQLVSAIGLRNVPEPTGGLLAACLLATAMRRRGRPCPRYDA